MWTANSFAFHVVDGRMDLNVAVKSNVPSDRPLMFVTQYGHCANPCVIRKT
jgi:hypothetical protein